MTNGSAEVNDRLMSGLSQASPIPSSDCSGSDFSPTFRIASDRRDAGVFTARLSKLRRSQTPEKNEMQPTDTAVVLIDPQNGVLSEKGANWGAVGARVTQNRTVENMEGIFRAAKANGFQVFISPHYFYPTDTGCRHDPPPGPAREARQLVAMN
jgi:hypothetical protein